MPHRPAILRALPMAVLLLAALAAAFFLRDWLSFSALSTNREALLAFRDAHYPLAALLYVGAYVLLVAFSIPGAVFATLTGGFLFGLWGGTLLTVTGATLGAICVFLAVRFGFGAQLAARIEAGGGAAARLKRGLDENQIPMLFIMRLVPLVPFFLANLIPAFLGVSLPRFAATTFLGIIPGSFVYTSVGAGLGATFDSGTTPNLGLIFAPHVLLPILGLAALAALPILIKSLRVMKG